MAKTINLQTIKILETTITEKSISVLYQVLDDANNVIINNRINILRTDLPPAGQNALDNFQEKILEKLINREL